MHIPDSMIQGHLCPVTAAVSTAGVALAAYFGWKSEKQPSIQRFAAVSSLIFALQMLNFPVATGTSGHLLGGVLAASMLGIPFGILAMALVVTLQCIVFADGGLTVLGLNVLNMAIIGAGFGGMLKQMLCWNFRKQRELELLSIFIVSWISVMTAAFAVCIELAISGTIQLGVVTSSMLSVHALIGVGEGMITVIACMLFETDETEARSSKHRMVWAPALTALIAAMLLSPFASGSPDGLEWVGEKLSFLKESAPNFVSPMPDYSLPFISSEAISTGMAGLLGVIFTFAIALSIGTLLKKPSITEAAEPVKTDA